MERRARLGEFQDIRVNQRPGIYHEVRLGYQVAAFIVIRSGSPGPAP